MIHIVRCTSRSFIASILDFSLPLSVYTRTWWYEGTSSRSTTLYFVSTAGVSRAIITAEPGICTQRSRIIQLAQTANSRVKRLTLSKLSFSSPRQYYLASYHHSSPANTGSSGGGQASFVVSLQRGFRAFQGQEHSSSSLFSEDKGQKMVLLCTALDVVPRHQAM